MLPPEATGGDYRFGYDPYWVRAYPYRVTVKPGESACYRCVFATEPDPGSVPSCREAGVLGATASIIGRSSDCTSMNRRWK